MQKWEYLIIEMSFDLGSQEKATKQVNQLGEQGWELITTVSHSSGNFAKLIFKRSKS